MTDGSEMQRVPKTKITLLALWPKVMYNFMMFAIKEREDEGVNHVSQIQFLAYQVLTVSKINRNHNAIKQMRRKKEKKESGIYLLYRR